MSSESQRDDAIAGRNDDTEAIDVERHRGQLTTVACCGPGAKKTLVDQQQRRERC